MPKTFSASAPATIMIAGEHAVLHGEPAICAALDKRLTVHLSPREDKAIDIISDQLGRYTTRTDDITVTRPFQFILGVLAHFQAQLPSGCTIQVNSEFSHQVGFGSSAAVTVATVRVVSRWLGLSYSPMDMLKASIAVIKKVQGLGSGADAAASIFGGVVFYQPQPLTVDVLPLIPNVSLIYSGYKTPTPEVVRLLDAKRLDNPTYYQTRFEQIGHCTRLAKHAIENQDWPSLGQHFRAHQHLQVEIGVSTQDIDQIIAQLAALESVHGAKISGSGLGDCVLAIGSLPKGYFPNTAQQQELGVKQFNVRLATQGLVNARSEEMDVAYEI